MKNKTLSFTFRAGEEDIKRIDQIQSRHGFRTRTKLLLHAGLQFDGSATDDQVMSMLARIVYAVRQLERASNGEVHLLKQTDITCIRRDVRRAMRHIVERTN